MSSLHDLAAVADFDTTITTGGTSELAIANMVSGNYFQLLGVAPQLGRVLGPADEQPAGPAVVISHPMWMNRFGGITLGCRISHLFARSAFRDCRRACHEVSLGPPSTRVPIFGCRFPPSRCSRERRSAARESDRYFGLIARLPSRRDR